MTEDADLSGLLSMEELLDAEAIQRQGGKLNTYFPEEGPYRRELYPKHTSFFDAGAEFRERLFMAGNRVGKTDVGSYEVSLHATGVYPPWWVGKKFNKPVRIWVCGDTTSTVRDITQEKLLGSIGQFGSGFLPQHTVGHTRMKRGISNAIDIAWVKHVTGGLSVVQFKSYDQRRESFQGTQQDVIWLDEEPPADVYAECLLRTTKTSDFLGGIIMLTFTPLNGLTDLVRAFIEEKITEDGESADEGYD